MGYYKYMREAWKKPNVVLQRKRYLKWRAEQRFTRLEGPTRIDSARSLGYRAKGGYIIVRTRMTKGGRKRPAPRAARKPTSYGRFVTPGKSLQSLLENRVSRKYPNLEVLNSYWVGDDGKNVWYEAILVDPYHPQIVADSRINWICSNKHKKRVYRGLTSSGKRGRGLHKKGYGVEKSRPSLAANKNRGN
jgi:large subunit ribosomal protein L15e